MKSLAVNNNGFYKRIKQSNTDHALSEYFRLLSKPMITNIKISYNNKNIRNLTETKFSSLYAGNDIIIAGKMENIKQFDNINFSVSISGTAAKKIISNNTSMIQPTIIQKKMDANIDIHGIQNQNTERIWAYLKLQQLSKQQLITNNDMIEMDDDEEKEEQSLGLSLGLKHKFVTPWTSMIVVKQKKEEEMEQKQGGSDEHDANANKPCYVFRSIYQIITRQSRL